MAVLVGARGVQGAGVRALLAHNWYVWTFNLKTVKVYTAEATWRAQVGAGVAGAGGRGSDARCGRDGRAVGRGCEAGAARARHPSLRP